MSHEMPMGKRQKGFTLLELLVVLVILGLLAAVAGPQVMKHVGGAKSDTAKLQVEEFSAALDMYKLEVGHYPSAQEGLQALVEAPANTTGWNGPYLKKNAVPKDPWGNDYHYEFPGKHGAVDIFSLGADNREGGEGEDKDLASWQ